MDAKATVSSNGAASKVENEDLEEIQEADNFEKIVNAFRYYSKHSMLRVQGDYMDYCHLPEKHRKLIHPTYPSHLAQLKDRIMHNNQIIRLVTQDVGKMYENKDYEADVQRSQARPASEFDMEKLQSTLRQVARDWSEEGKLERDNCYKPVVDELLKRFPDFSNRHHVKIVVPGAGLGRLAWDLAHEGFWCQGNEFSLFMLFLSNFILNRCQKADEFTLFPWIHQTCNNISYADQLRPITFPDVSPNQLPKEHPGFSMAAGDFLDVYHEDRDRWDCVATVFFLDTARNIIEYVEQIYTMLKPGGLWINIGPLLYHFADTPNEHSIELPYEELKRVIQTMGFEYEQEHFDIKTPYTHNSKSMLTYMYNCVYFVCVKPPKDESE